MIWVTWRQARFELLLGLAVLAAITTFYIWSGLDAASTYHNAGIAACLSGNIGSDACMTNIDAFIRKFDNVRNLAVWLNFLPLFLGMLIAAPAVLELESGTYRMAWTQGVTRGRWLLVKIGFGVAVSAIVAAGLVVLWTWWRGPFDAIQGRFENNAFDFEGTVPIAYTIYAFALCLAAGTVFRRTVLAIAVGFVGFLAVRLGIENTLRAHYMKPISATWDLLDPTPASVLTRMGDGNWVLSQDLVDSAGHALQPGNPVADACMPGARIELGNSTVAKVPGDRASVDACLHDHGVMNQLVYQPAHRFWAFQGIETAIFLGLTLVLLGITVWWVQKRIA
jgi:hypothetical protein